MPQDFVVVREIIAVTGDSFEVHNSVKTSPETFKQLFNVDYPSGLQRGDVVSKIPCGGGVDLTVVWGQEIEWINNTKIVTNSPMTVGSWTLWKVLSDKGFKLLDSRNYYTKRDSESIFNGRHLVERVFVRDV